MKPIFRNSMFGFQKSDVVRFIAKQSSMHEAKVAELNDEIDKMRKEHELEIEELMKDRVALTALQEDNLKKLNSVLQLRRIVDELKLGQENFVEVFGENKGNIEAMSGEIVSLRSALEESEKFREKAVKFDQLANVLNGIVNGVESNLCQLDTEEKKVSFTVDLDMVKAFSAEQEIAVASLIEKVDEILRVLESLTE